MVKKGEDLLILLEC